MYIYVYSFFKIEIGLRFYIILIYYYLSIFFLMNKYVDFCFFVCINKKKML